MDKIILVEDGSVTAVGTHNELCRTCEEYAKMVKLQKLEDEGGEI
jgi:ATP-binding cassette subfamily B protein